MTSDTLAMEGVFRGLQILLRAIDNAAVPDADAIVFSTELAEEAQASLKAVSGRIEEFTLLKDVSIGWRSLEFLSGEGLSRPPWNLPSHRASVR